MERPANSPEQPHYRSNFTLRSLITGLLIGILINLTNTYYGLRVGSTDPMSMVSTLLGFTVFKLLGENLSRSENVLLLSVATATGAMPATAGFVGIIPALEFMIDSSENGPLSISFGNLLVWSLGLCFFGITFASLLRKPLVEQERLPWPGASATARLIDTLHPKMWHDPISHSTEQGSAPLSEASADGLSERVMPVSDSLEWGRGVRRLLKSSVASAFASILMCFAPVAHALPVFGPKVSQEWLWNLDLSPGFIGQGLVIGPTIALHMLSGSIFGWAIMSPLAKYKGWAPGDVDNWENGSRGWIIWIALGSLLADASVKLLWFIVRPLTKAYKLHSLQYSHASERNENTEINDSQASEQSPLLRHRSMDNPDEVLTELRRAASTKAFARSQWADSTRHDKYFTISLAGFFVSVVICILGVHIYFKEYIPWYFTLLAIGLSLPMTVVGIRAIAEVDDNPESALVSQLVFAGLISHTNPNVVIANLISAAIAQAGSNQGSDLAYDLKVGYLVGAAPKDQERGQMIGSIFGAFVSCVIYRLYTSYYPIPGPLFQVPASYLVLSTARLILGRGLPEGVMPFTFAAIIISAIVTIVKMCYANHWWEKLLPSGVAFAMGIYLPPSFVLSRAIGGLLSWACRKYCGYSKDSIIITASGLILGESIASLVAVALTALHVPTLFLST